MRAVRKYNLSSLLKNQKKRNFLQERQKSDKKKTIDYETLVQESLRNVVRDSLTIAARQGLPGKNHFYISYSTHFPGVDLPDYLREEYPDEITIVLQYEFWDLEVYADQFQVTLCFNDIHERLTVPFKAITSFVDPSVKFGLHFDADIAEREVPLDLLAEKKKAPKKEPSLKAASDTPAEEKSSEADPSEKDSNIVTLDSFRKK